MDGKEGRHDGGMKKEERERWNNEKMNGEKQEVE